MIIFAIGFYITHVFLCFSGPVAKHARFFIIFAEAIIYKYFCHRTGHVVKCGRFCLSLHCILFFVTRNIYPAPLRNAAGFFCAIPDLAVFRRFPGLSPVGWYKLSSGP